MTDAAGGGLLVQRIVYAGLEAIRAATPLDLAAYLHEAPDQGPQLFLGSPTLADIDPTAAFNLFGALRDGLGADRDGEDLDVPGYRAVAVTTRGLASRGVHVLGRSGAVLSAGERDVAVRLARTFAALAHSVEELAPADSGTAASETAVPVRVVVETIDGGAQATVSVAVDGETRTQTAEASGSARAVAAAAVACIDPSLKIIEAGEEQIGGSRAVLALVAGADGRHLIGSALVHDNTDALRATAIAALDAAARRTR